MCVLLPTIRDFVILETSQYFFLFVRWTQLKAADAVIIALSSSRRSLWPAVNCFTLSPREPHRDVDEQRNWRNSWLRHSRKSPVFYDSLCTCTHVLHVNVNRLITVKFIYALARYMAIGRRSNPNDLWASRHVCSSSWTRPAVSLKLILFNTEGFQLIFCWMGQKQVFESDHLFSRLMDSPKKSSHACIACSPFPQLNRIC